MIYLQSGKYFYKKTNNGKMTRISKEVYMENIDKIEEASGGTGELSIKPIIKKNPRIRSYTNMPLEEGGFAFLIRLQNQKFIQTTKYFKINNNNKIYNIVRNNINYDTINYKTLRKNNFSIDYKPINNNKVIKVFNAKSIYGQKMLHDELKNLLKLEKLQYDMDDNKRFTPKLYGFIENLNIIGELEKKLPSHFTRSSKKYGIIFDDGGVNLNMLENLYKNDRELNINFKDFVNILTGLKLMHDSGLVHFDIKGLNILYNTYANNNNGKFYLIDFGTLKSNSNKINSLINSLKYDEVNSDQIDNILYQEYGIILQGQHPYINNIGTIKQLDIVPLAKAMYNLVNNTLDYNDVLKEKLLSFFMSMEKQKDIGPLIEEYEKIFNNIGGKNKNKNKKKLTKKVTKTKKNK